MNLRKTDIAGNRALCKKAKALYKSAFPKEERVPWWLLRLTSHAKHSSIDAYLDGDMFCGFTFSTVVDNMYFVMFFAVDDAIRGKGYGSAILSKIKNDNPDKTVVLNIEPIVEDAENLEERKNRLAFYQKNGFKDTGYLVREVGGVFSVMSTSDTVDVATYKKVFKAVTGGLWDVEIKKAELWK